MKLQKFYRSGVLLCAALLGFAAAALPAAAEIELEDDEYILQDSSDDTPPTYESGDYTYTKLTASDGSGKQAACIESFNSRTAELEIPSELDGLAVVQLGKNAFVDADYLQTVTLPATLTELGDYAFVNCRKLTEYRVESGNPVFEAKDGVLYSGEGTVLERYPLGLVPTDVVIPDGITGVGNVAFACCESMTSLSLPDSLKSIGIAAFSDCPGLKSVVIPDGVTVLSDFAFNSCTNLAEVTLPSKLESIGFATFAATGLSKVTLPDTVTSIGRQAFAQTNLAEILLPKSVEEIGEKAFGYTLDENGELHMNTDFIIGGELGTGAEQYARSGGENRAFNFVNTGASAEEIEAAEKKNSTVRVIGIIVCVLLLIAIAVFVFIKGKNQKNTEKKPDPESAEKVDGETEPDETDTEEPETADAEAAAPEEEDASEEENGDE